MGTSLNGLTPAGTYPGLIKTGDNAPIDGTLKTLSDGNGNNLPMAVSTTAVNFTNQLQQGGVAVPTASQVNAKQDTLVSGTNIKTINGTSVLGSGNIVTPTTSPSGVSGAIQFSNGSAFASDASNLFWDDANNRLGIGTNAPTQALEIGGGNSIKLNNDGSLFLLGTRFATNNGTVYFGDVNGSNTGVNLIPQGGGANGSINFGASALAQFKGKGSTSATTSLLVQNSSGVASLQVTDDGSVFNYGKGSINTNNIFGRNAFQNNTTGVQNSSFGWESLFYNSTSGYNSAFGARALYTNTGVQNSAFGAYALYSTSSGANNVAVGMSALELNSTGSSNSALGHSTSSGNFSGSVILGREATATANNQFVVGSTAYNAGAVNSTTDVPATFLWSVRINGTNYKILMTT